MTVTLQFKLAAAQSEKELKKKIFLLLFHAEELEENSGNVFIWYFLKMMIHHYCSAYDQCIMWLIMIMALYRYV